VIQTLLWKIVGLITRKNLKGGEMDIKHICA